ncbi:hypothetical protein P153DRAFT_371558 [Dothidotthia symphoricarpi CBS 119687]|uniref:Uncharacterized protein n=1 Tax=Dothidotthia symphoricarpi CBS 119687 TaxID=1392245 RepID=A0A6A5ZXF5_9PLEO|nr:uncharacterized protein P153DRAFT_371558 [Dothidotthia symphoricarpi CBS 119687]KAF2123583.1 hypothetical protein P153DRAFT_371558 [Dothidotthia symphoricarpi CBS 119687]
MSPQELNEFTPEIDSHLHGWYVKLRNERDQFRRDCNDLSNRNKELEERLENYEIGKMSTRDQLGLLRAQVEKMKLEDQSISLQSEVARTIFVFVKDLVRSREQTRDQLKLNLGREAMKKHMDICSRGEIKDVYESILAEVNRIIQRSRDGPDIREHLRIEAWDELEKTFPPA